MKKVLLHISGNQYAPFPATHHTRRIWEELSRGFDEYHLLARGNDNRYRHSIQGNIHLHLLPAFGRRMWVFFLLSWVLPFFVIRCRPTHLLAQCPVLGGLAAALCSRLFGIPLLVELHGAHYFNPSRPGVKGELEHLLYRVLSPAAFRAAVKIRCLSDHMVEELDLVYGPGAAAKAVVVPNRVDLTVFREVKQSYELGGPLRVVSVGSFIPLKNHLRLLEDLHASGVDFRLSLVGGGPLKDAYLETARRLGVAERLEIHENLSHDELSRLLPRHDLYIHYSTTEAVSRAILEAMAAGLPVIATTVGFIRGVLAHGENALLLRAPWSDDLPGLLRELRDSEALRSRLGRGARRSIEEKFEWNRVFSLYRREILTCEPGIVPKMVPPCVS